MDCNGIFIKIITLFIVIVFMLSLGNNEVEGRLIISEEEDTELERHLKILNKPPVKTIHTEWGDIYDCIDIYKQPAFNHPLLKNHTIQMKPSKELKYSTSEAQNVDAPVESCPKGTVPIRRTSKEDLIRAKYLSSPESISNDSDEYWAGIEYSKSGETFPGASARINLWEPHVIDNQSSSAVISLRSGTDNQYTEIRYGWTANRILYGNETGIRYFAYWTADNGQRTGCYNMMCPGFVQVHPRYPLDNRISKTSVYDGVQWKNEINVFLDVEGKKWWLLRHGNIAIGYWPAELFPLFGKTGAERIYWGGHSRDNGDGHGPQMGSGYFPDKNYHHAAWFKHMKYYDDESLTFVDPDEKLMERIIGCQRHYDVWYFGLQVERGHTLQFGGPGGKC